MKSISAKIYCGRGLQFSFPIRLRCLLIKVIIWKTPNGVKIGGYETEKSAAQRKPAASVNLF